MPITDRDFEQIMSGLQSLMEGFDRGARPAQTMAQASQSYLREMGGASSSQTAGMLPRIMPSTGRPILDDPKGGFETEKSITVTHPMLNGGQPTNIPSIWGGQHPPYRFGTREFEDWAVNHAIRSGQTFKSFGSIDEAVAAARARSGALGDELKRMGYQ